MGKPDIVEELLTPVSDIPPCAVEKEAAATIIALRARVAELEQIVTNCHREIYSRDAEIKRLRDVPSAGGGQ